MPRSVFRNAGTLAGWDWRWPDRDVVSKASALTLRPDAPCRARRSPRRTCPSSQGTHIADSRLDVPL